MTRELGICHLSNVHVICAFMEIYSELGPANNYI
jgi:hypothetical protein